MSLAAYAKQNGVKYFLISFVDLFGVMRAKLVPATAIDAVAKAGAGFAGFAAWLDMTPAHPDMLVMPDPATVMQLPWKPEVAWVTGDLVMDGKPVEQNPRQVLKRVMADAARDGYEMKTGVECEYFLISRDGQQISDDADTQSQALLRPAGADAALRGDQGDLRRHDRARLGALPERSRGRERPVRDELGLRRLPEDRRPARVLQVHGQVDRREARAARDVHAEAVHQPHRQRLPRARVAVVDRRAPTCSTTKRRELGLSPLAYNFIGGLIHSADALAAITNPTVNSYKRINAPRTRSGATWSPNTVTYAGNNRTHMIRIPDRRPLRAAPRRRRDEPLPAAGRHPRVGPRRHPQQARSRQAPRHRHVRRGALVKDAKRLPLNLLDALRTLERFERAQGRARRGDGRDLSATEARRLERLRTAPHGRGSAHTTLDC